LLLFNQKYWDRFKRKKWFVDGDRNSRYFQQIVKNRRKRNTVLKLKDESGVWLDTQQEIAEKLVADFARRFTTNCGVNTRLHDLQTQAQVMPSDNIALLRVPNRDEIKQALFSIDSTKTPAPDGYGAGFFKKFWNIIQQDFYESITDFLHGANYLGNLTIRLLP